MKPMHHGMGALAIVGGGENRGKGGRERGEAVMVMLALCCEEKTKRERVFSR